MSLLCAVAICKQATWHRSLENIVLTLASYGTLIFVAPDYLTGCLNMQPFGEPGCSPPYTPFYFFFVYYGVIINWVWFMVPIVMLWYNVREDFAAAPKAKAA